MNEAKILYILSVITLLFFSSCASVNEEQAKKDEQLPPLSESELKILQIMGGRVLPDGNLAIGKVVINRKNNQISFPGSVNLTEGDLEVLICTPAGRTHESLLVSDIDPYHLQLALLLIGAENGIRKAPVNGENKPDNKDSGIAQGTLVDIFVKTDKGKEVPVEHWLENKRKSAEKGQEGWVFVGSSFASGKNKKCLATEEGNIVNIWSFGNTILDNPAENGDEDNYLVSLTKNMPPYETPVTIIMKLKEKEASVEKK